MPVQRRNDEMVSLLGADVQKRYESSYAWKTACSMFQSLTSLRAFWPMGPSGATGAAIDLSGHARTAGYNGNPTYDFDGLAPYIRFDGTGDYLSVADAAGIDITGTETTIAAGHRGITLGGWFRPEDDTTKQGLITKWSQAAGNYSYALWLRGDVANDPVRFEISDDGTNTDTVDSGATTDSEWQFMAGRFNDSDTGAELAVWLDGTMTTAATARASIFSGNANLLIGGSDGPINLYTGRASMVFLCAAALADATVWALYQHTRALFKV